MKKCQSTYVEKLLVLFQLDFTKKMYPLFPRLSRDRFYDKI